MKKFILSLALVFSLALTSFAFVGCGKDKYPTEPSQNAKTVNVVMTSATIPPMLSLLDTVGTTNKTYMWIGRQNTVNSVDNLKTVYPGVTFIEEWSTASNIPASVVNKMSQSVAQEYHNAKGDCKFEIYVTDYGVLAALYLVHSLKMPASFYKIHLCEDGSGAYTQFFNGQKIDPDSDDSELDQDYDNAELGKIHFDANLNGLKSIISQMQKGKYNAARAFSDYKYVYPATTLENVDYYLQYPEMLYSDNAEIRAMLGEGGAMKLVKKHQTALYNALSDENKASLKSIILGSDLDAMMTPEQGKEKILMITGTSFTGEGNGNLDPAQKGEGCRFEQLVTYLVEKYGDTHTIVYKGHPSWGLLEDEVETSRWVDPTKLPEISPNVHWTAEQGRAAAARRKEFLEDNGIKILPAQTPAEAFIWAYSDVMDICGYDSSLYFNAPSEHMVCFLTTKELTGNFDEKCTQCLSALNVMLFKTGGQLHNDNIYFLDLAYIQEHSN